MEFKTNKEDIWTILIIWKSAPTSNWKTKAQYQMKTWTNIYYVQSIFFATFLDISTTETVCCCLSN